MSEPRIGDARDDELAPLAPLLSRVRPLEVPYTADVLLRFTRVPDNWCLVASVDGRIAAGAIVTGGGEWRQPDRAFMVPSFVVDDAHRGRGIGTALAQALEARAFAAGAARVVTSIQGDADASLRFAHARGFREFHREAWALLDLRTWQPRRPVESVPGVDVVSIGEVLALPDDERASLVAGISAAHRELLADLPSSEITFPERTPPDYERATLRRLDPDASLIALRRVSGRAGARDVVEVLALVLVRTSAKPALMLAAGEVGAGRGRKLIVPLKVRAIERLRRGGTEEVASLYDRDNAVTRQLNRSLGFVRQPPQVRLELRRERTSLYHPTT